MKAVLTAEDVRRQDAESPVPVAMLMENAGWAVARAARRMMAGTYGRRVVVVRGKGNNAGDGLVAARILRDRGAHVTVVNVFEDTGMLAKELARADLAIDAIFGVGLNRAPDGEVARAIQALNESGRAVLAVDVPSGVASDTGAVPSVAVRATATVTFTGYKPGLLFAPGAAYAGAIEIARIGIGDMRGTAVALGPEDWRTVADVRSPSSHKRNVGTVLVVAGSRAMPGAAALTVAAAVHAGAGLTTLCAPESVCAIVVARVPEITTIPLPETGEGTIDAKAIELLRPRLPEFDAIALGPGLSTHPGTVEFVRAFVAETRTRIVIDADGLNALAGATDVLAARENVVITPHAGELARLTALSASELSADRIAAARDAARTFGCVVLFKGPGTVITDGTSTFVNSTGGAMLAQGGTGDVLTGIVAARLATLRARSDVGAPDTDAHEAATARVVEEVARAAWLHGYAADRIAARIAPHPANAAALVDELGPAMHEVRA